MGVWLGLPASSIKQNRALVVSRRAGCGDGDLRGREALFPRSLESSKLRLIISICVGGRAGAGAGAGAGLRIGGGAMAAADIFVKVF